MTNGYIKNLSKESFSLSDGTALTHHHLSGAIVLVDAGNGVYNTTAFTIGINTGALMFAIAILYGWLTRQSVSVPSSISI